MRPSSRFLPKALVGLFLALSLSLPSTVATAQTADPGYILGPNDQIEVSIYGQPDKGVKTRIKADGSITMPLIGSIPAAGRNTADLATDVQNRLQKGGFVNNPIVNVEVLEFISHSVTILGSVGTPGVYPLDRPQTVGAMVARAGGIRDGGSDYVVLRRAKDNSAQRLSLASLAQDASKDVALQPGDTLYVGRLEFFYIYGQVNSPGSFPIVAGMSLRQALARGGGPTLAGTEKRVMLYRNRQPRAEADLDSDVMPGDVLYVRERTF